jgi:hypothetical protein
MQNRDRNRSGLAGFVVAVLAFALAGAVHAEVKVPMSVEDHLALAKQYQEKAATYRAEAKTHREMAEAYKKSTLSSHAAAHGQKNPKTEKAVAHCNAIATAAEKLATENEKAADYHNLRAKELQGK